MLYLQCISFRAGIACSTEAVPIRINLIAPPLYVITTSTPEKQEGLDALNAACKVIEERIGTFGGSFNIQMAPKVVTATDEADLAKQMAKAEEENAEVRLVDRLELMLAVLDYCTRANKGCTYFSKIQIVT